MEIDKVLKEIAEDSWLTQITNYVPSAWLGHAPFLRYLIREVRPEIFVELGTHNGFSYFVACQTVQELGLPTRTYAVDSWAGDPHAGTFDDSVFKAVLELNEQYKGFSTLLKMSFLEALGEVADGSVNLLHIDGFHTYDAVRQDFETWLPKMSKNGIILLHDIHVRHANFGVFKYWAELKKQYSTIEFVSSYGLGVVFLGEPESAKLIQLITISRKDDPAHIHGTFGGLSDTVIQTYRNIQSSVYSAQISKLNAQKLEIQSKLLAVLNSKSWKITKPIRLLGELIRKVSHR
jgi:O-antigen biosynthesis protein